MNGRSSASRDAFRMHREVHEGLVAKDTLFIHGNLASSRWWHPALKVWKSRREGSRRGGRLIFADWRGCGLSPAPENRSEMRLPVLAGDYLRLLDELGCSRVNVVGHSTGGAIALTAMGLSPERFHKAVLLDSVGARGVRFGPEMHDAFKRMSANRDVTAAVVAATVRGMDPADPFLKEVLAEDAFRAVHRLGTWVLDELDGIDLREEVGSLPHEVLVLHGEHDLLLAKADSVELGRLLPEGRFLELPGRGHSANVEDPEGFVKTVEGFLFD